VEKYEIWSMPGGEFSLLRENRLDSFTREHFISHGWRYVSSFESSNFFEAHKILRLMIEKTKYPGESR
jgi:hypothetical protein